MEASIEVLDCAQNGQLPTEAKAGAQGRRQGSPTWMALPLTSLARESVSSRTMSVRLLHSWCCSTAAARYAGCQLVAANSGGTLPGHLPCAAALARLYSTPAPSEPLEA